MKNFKDVCAQGDVLIRRVGSIPKGCAEITAANGRIVVTHSETGHDHVMVLDRPKSRKDVPAVQMFSGGNPLIAWMQVNRPTALEHMRPHDTHEPIMFGVGVYEIRRQREYTPEGFRRVED